MKADCLENVAGQRLHSYGRSPVWTREWRLRLDFCANVLSHRSHCQGFSSECVSLCLTNTFFWENSAGHESHENGFSPGVRPVVAGKEPPSREPSAAVFALIRLFSAVCEQVSRQVETIRELGRAMAAFERLFARVCTRRCLLTLHFLWGTFCRIQGQPWRFSPVACLKASRQVFALDLAERAKACDLLLKTEGTGLAHRNGRPTKPTASLTHLQRTYQGRETQGSHEPAVLTSTADRE
ncbi:hypothetical protein MRX96_035436 [Rhipicephalus microplus]